MIMNTSQSLTIPPAAPERERAAPKACPAEYARDLHAIADRIQGQARRLENLATWWATLQRYDQARQAGEPLSMADQLRHIQALRLAGVDTDKGFFWVCLMAELWALEYMTANIAVDPKFNELLDAIEIIQRRERRIFPPDDPDAPEEIKALENECKRRRDAIVDSAMVVWLVRHGEDEIAELWLTNKAEFLRRREPGGYPPCGRPSAQNAETATQGGAVPGQAVPQHGGAQ